MKAKVLFLGTGNSCRSQMAEGWVRHLLTDEIDPCSAGIKAQRMNPFATRVMLEWGVDISDQCSKSVDSLAALPFDLVVTASGQAAENCPKFLGNARVIHAGFNDPSTTAIFAATEEETFGHYRRARDEIRTFVAHELFKHFPHRHFVS